MELELNPENYAGIPDEFAGLESAKMVVLQFPYDGTSTWGKGADKGPAALLEATENMELYDIETRSEVFRHGIHLPEPIALSKAPESMVEEVCSEVSKYIEMGKYTSSIGGEHSISIGTIRAHRNKYKNLTVVQLDAHADLRPEYHGSACNHACALFESSQNDNLIQVGIRSMDKLEEEFMDRSKTYFAQDIYAKTDWMQQAIDQMGEQVFITIDLDVFDGGMMPSTGTPEPGGMDFYTVLTFCRMIHEQKTVVGFDVVELAPNPDNLAPDFLAAKLFYKLLTYKFEI